jgi:TadE-like protein
MTRNRLHRLLRHTSGSNMIEAAIITPLLLLVVFSIVEFATFFYVYLALENGVGQATRFGVTGGTTGAIVSAMRQATPTLAIPDEAFSFAHMAPGAGGWTSGPGGPGDVQKLRVDYTWHAMTPLMRVFFTDGEMHLTVESAMKNEELFQ